MREDERGRGRGGHEEIGDDDDDIVTRRQQRRRRRRRCVVGHVRTRARAGRGAQGRG